MKSNMTVCVCVCYLMLLNYIWLINLTWIFLLSVLSAHPSRLLNDGGCAACSSKSKWNDVDDGDVKLNPEWKTTTNQQKEEWISFESRQLHPSTLDRNKCRSSSSSSSCVVFNFTFFFVLFCLLSVSVARKIEQLVAGWLTLWTQWLTECVGICCSTSQTIPIIIKYKL